ncbi:GNAT family N-acetyltransferase [Fictibacillus phosphorivorans]|uniref:GNAT family N-acetyltransferase n=1 Tax=Fictibacillus phosphorivorans TaxID=1221500 RepID=UPI00203CCB21|nr:GNAT family N-acetyltransferase [Fictibacillus phosphorivorans]MCM3718652.1 GNAT family N-acetyltransferase [Fictibacillus phosphorivorans]MCM3776275.1 GNAT family N-acetyltransferase [Fictibacillus phosphorivorans]
MIIKADQTLHEKIMNYLSDEPALNLFIIGDIENFGYETDFQDIWVDQDEAGELQGVLLRYMGNYLPYSKGAIHAEGFSEIISKDKNYEMLSGKKEITEQFRPYVTFNRTKEMYFAELKDDSLLNKNRSREGIQQATIQDVDSLLELKKQIKEFTIRETARHSLEQALKTKTGRTYFMKDENIIVSCASTTAENSLSAMIVGVCSHPEKRNQGLATACMEAVCQDVLSEGKTLCLFYDNPKAGSIYKRLGFKDIGIWSMNFPVHMTVPENNPTQESFVK